MRAKIGLWLGVGASVVILNLSSCGSGREYNIEPPKNKNQKSPDGTGGSGGSGGGDSGSSGRGGNLPQSQGGQTVKASIFILADGVAPFLDANGQIAFNLSYLGVTQSGQAKFVGGGRGSIENINLEQEQTSDLVVELQTGGIAKFRGKIVDFKVGTGPVPVTITMSQLDGNSAGASGDADVAVRVTIGNSRPTAAPTP